MNKIQDLVTDLQVLARRFDVLAGIAQSDDDSRERSKNAAQLRFIVAVYLASPAMTPADRFHDLEQGRLWLAAGRRIAAWMDRTDLEHLPTLTGPRTAPGNVAYSHAATPQSHQNVWKTA